MFDKKTLLKLERQLHERHGVNLKESLDNLYHLDVTVKEFLGEGIFELVKKIHETSTDFTEYKEHHEWLTIDDENLVKTILESYADKQKRSILTALVSKALTFPEIVRVCQIPQTTCYRMVLSLLQQGLVTRDGFVTNRNRLKIPKFIAIFDNLKIDIEKERAVCVKASKRVMALPLNTPLHPRQELVITGNTLHRKKLFYNKSHRQF